MVGGKLLFILDFVWEIDFFGNGGLIFDFGIIVIYWLLLVYRNIFVVFDKNV